MWDTAQGDIYLFFLSENAFLCVSVWVSNCVWPNVSMCCGKVFPKDSNFIFCSCEICVRVCVCLCVRMGTGKPVWGESGELVCLKPIPCQPTHFWNDENGSKYHKAYFSSYPGKDTFFVHNNKRTSS